MILGWDTETFRGQVKLLADSAGHYIESSATDALLNYLYHYGKEAEYNVFWNIGFDLSCILRAWVVENRDVLRKNHYREIKIRQRLGILLANQIEVSKLSPEERSERAALEKELGDMLSVERFSTALFKVVYVSGKAFSIKPKKGRHKAVWFFDASNFYSLGFGGTALDATAQKYLGEGKDLGGLSREKIGEEEGYYEAHRAQVIKYCIRDCELTAKLFELTVHSFTNLELPFPERPFSKASVSKAFLRDSGVMTETQKVYLEFVRGGPSRFWTRSYRGGVFLQLGFGHFEDVYQFDIASAYPDAMRTLPSLEGATMEMGGMNGAEPLGFFLVRAPRSLLFPEKRNHRLDYSRGPTTLGYVTGPDLDTLNDWGVEFELVEGLSIACPSDVRPLSYVEGVYEKKNEIKAKFGSDSVEYWNVKVFLNGGYGILAQRKPRDGPLTNLIYASYITALCRQQLFTKALEIERAGGRVLAYATDGLLVDGRSFPLSEGKELGSWGVEKLDSVTLFESGVYVKKKNGEETLKRRGMPNITIEQLRNVDAPTLTVRKASPVKLKSAIIQQKTPLIGAFVESDRTLNPASAASKAGFVVPEEWVRKPLKDYFKDSIYFGVP